jgi:hypothetical protein
MENNMTHYKLKIISKGNDWFFVIYIGSKFKSKFGPFENSRVGISKGIKHLQVITA